MWKGDYTFTTRCLVEKDFKIRYRNMSLGMFWSLLNPLIMMGVLWFIFVKVFPGNTMPYYPLAVLCGIVPFNFFSIAWANGTSSLLDSVGLVKRVPVPRQIIPIASVVSNCMHLLIQVGLLLVLVLAFGPRINIEWLWLPVLWALEIVFVCGLALIFSAVNVYVRDARYFVESANNILFWLVPVFYSFSIIPARFREIYMYNPIAALVMALRNILLEGRAPASSLLSKLTLVSFGTLVVGWFVFKKLQERFYEYL